MKTDPAEPTAPLPQSRAGVAAALPLQPSPAADDLKAVETPGEPGDANVQPV